MSEHKLIMLKQFIISHKTIIIIAHRLSTVRNCQKLIFMKSGSVVDMGSMKELIGRNSDFGRMVNAGSGFASDAPRIEAF